MHSAALRCTSVSMQSLKDKLLLAGVVNKTDVERAETVKAPGPTQAQTRGTLADKPRREPSERPTPKSAQPSRLPKFAPMVGSPQANREASRKQLALDRFIRERVLSSQVHLEDGITPFYFVTRKNKLRKLLLSETQAAQVRAGDLAIVERPDPGSIEYTVVPAATAAELLPLSQRTVRFWNNPQSPVGFVSDADIAKGDHETEAVDKNDSVNEGDDVNGSAESSPGSASDAETFVTIKRAPLS
jgi:uncharacterized protein YaiL (DUF2058 family)